MVNEVLRKEYKNLIENSKYFIKNGHKKIIQNMLQSDSLNNSECKYRECLEQYVVNRDFSSGNTNIKEYLKKIIEEIEFRYVKTSTGCAEIYIDDVLGSLESQIRKNLNKLDKKNIELGDYENSCMKEFNNLKNINSKFEQEKGTFTFWIKKYYYQKRYNKYKNEIVNISCKKQKEMEKFIEKTTKQVIKELKKIRFKFYMKLLMLRLSKIGNKIKNNIFEILYIGINILILSKFLGYIAQKLDLKKVFKYILVKAKEKPTVAADIGCTLILGFDTLNVIKKLKKRKEDNIIKQDESKTVLQCVYNSKLIGKDISMNVK